MGNDDFISRKDIIKNNNTTETGIENTNEFEDREVLVEIKESQKTYIWMRAYLREDFEINEGEKVFMKYLPSNEQIETIFGAYNKKNIDKDVIDTVIEYEAEDDKKCLCLMVDLEDVNNNSNIPFIRTLFRQGRYFDSNNLLLREDEIKFTTENGVDLDYYMMKL